MEICGGKILVNCEIEDIKFYDLLLQMFFVVIVVAFLFFIF